MAGKRVYSPDIEPYSFEGKSGLFNTISFIITAPIRLVTRVMHNLLVMPANVQEAYADGLLVVALLTAALGVIDYIMFHKWVLVVSQLPLIPLAIKVKKDATAARGAAKEKRKVDIDKGQISALVGTVYDDLNKVLKE